MGCFVSKEAVRIQLENSEEWIEIKPKLSLGDRNRLADALMEIDTSKGGDEVAVSLRTGRYLVALMETAIVNWHLLDDGKPVKFDRRQIAELDVDDPLVDKTLNEIVARNPFGARSIGLGSVR